MPQLRFRAMIFSNTSVSLAAPKYVVIPMLPWGVSAVQTAEAPRLRRP